MKAALCLLMLGCTLCAQTQPPLSPATPPIRATPEQPAPTPSVTPDAVVAEVDGKKYTAAEVAKLLDDYPPQMQLAIKADPKKALSLVLLTRYLAGEAEKAKLDEQSPLKEALAYQRTRALAQAQLDKIANLQINPTSEQEEKYYKTNQDRYQEAKIKVIQVAFSANPVKSSDPNAKKPLTEAEAKSKIEDLRKKLEGGADFAQLAKESSDDKESAAKGGDFPPLKRNSSYAEAIKNAVFALKPGQISEPLRQPNGFYLIRLEELKIQPYSEVQNQIHQELKQAGFNEYMQGLQKRYDVKVENPDYFKAKPPAATPPAR